MDSDQDDYGSNEDGESDEEDLDHDEIILGNTTDVLVAISKAFGNSFLPYFQTIAPKLVKYLGDDHPKSDKMMMLGCLSEIMNNCPAVLDQYFNNFMTVVMQHTTSKDGLMVRNCSYAIGILAQKAP
jgi:hypothetical protein